MDQVFNIAKITVAFWQSCVIYRFVSLCIDFRKAAQEILYEREKLEAAFDPQLQKEVS